MKRFCYNIFTFFTIILLFNGILLLFAINKYYSGYEKRPDKSYSAFILSDSHGLPIGNYSEKYRVFNFSAGSDSYFDMKKKIIYLVENNYNVDKIYITVDDHTLSPYREKTDNLDRSVVYSSPSEYENHFKYLKEKYVKYYLPIFQPKVSYLFKSYLKVKLRNIYQTNDNSPMENSWDDLSESKKINNSEGRKKSQFPSNDRSEKLQNTLLEIISICQTNDIELIGIKFPLSKTYIEVLNGLSYGADVLFISNNLKVIDLKEIFIDNPEFFQNQDHMNDKGGKLFTEMLFKN